MSKILDLGKLGTVLKAGAGKSGGRGTFIQQSRRKSSEEKAIYHNVSGAGASHVIRRFFDLSEEDVRAITDRVDRGLAAAVRRF